MAREFYQYADVTHQIIGAFFDVYNELRPGLRESVYERAMVIALQERAVPVEQQVPMAVGFHDQPVGSFRADLVVSRNVLVELKALPSLKPAHVAQSLNALKACGHQIGLLLNFGPTAQIKRLIISRKNEAPTDRR